MGCIAAVELGQEVPGAGQVEEVVVRELLSVELLEVEGETIPGPVQRSLLGGVLAVAQQTATRDADFPDLRQMGTRFRGNAGGSAGAGIGVRSGNGGGIGLGTVPGRLDGIGTRMGTGSGGAPVFPEIRREVRRKIRGNGAIVG